MKYLKSLTTLILGLCILVLSPLNVHSQDLNSVEDQEPVILDVEGFRAEFKQYTQDPETKIVKFEMILNSNIDSDRVEVLWTLTGSSRFVDSTQARRTFTVKRGGSYSITIEVTPSGLGASELFGKAEAFRAESNYIATVRKNYVSNSSGEILPITSEYTSAKTLAFIKNIIITAVLIAGVAAGAYYGYKAFKKWLDAK